MVARLTLDIIRNAVMAPAAAVRPGPDGKLAFVIGKIIEFNYAEWKPAGRSART